ncbi:MAG: DUF11 domain-containing protein [Thermoguttaceae bacterium]|nr:DUF11 domain-containing protein [Thermoguttaceae bacterium]MBQ5367009.1 DUF11 domain-containing protein [Thermoguttaceae bacterium]
MKRSALQCVVGFVGATLIVAGVVWTCRQISSPTELSAAQGTTAQNLRSSQTETGQRPTGSLSLSVASEPISTNAPSLDDAEYAQGGNTPAASGSALNLSVVDPEAAPMSSPNAFPTVDPLTDEAGDIDSSFDNSFPNVETPEAPVSTQQPRFSPSEAEINDRFEQNGLGETSQAAPQGSISVVQQDAGVPIPMQALDEAPKSDFPAPAATVEINDLHDDEQGVTPFPAVSESPRNINALDEQLDGPVPTMQSRSANTVSTEDVAPFSASASPAPNFNQIPQANGMANGALSDALLQFVARSAASLPTPNEEFEGPQTTQITVEKTAPEEVRTNKPAQIVVSVKNLGKKTVKNIVLRDSVPTGAQFESGSSDVAPNQQGELIWPAFELQPGAEKKFEYSIIPTQEGTFGSVATVMIAASASSQTKCSQPELKVEVTAADSVELGEKVVFDIVVSNVGTGVANNVKLEERIPNGLHHPQGDVLNNTLGTLNPGESKRLPLTLESVAAGEVVNILTISADGCEAKSAETRINIVAPMLELAISGPQKAYLGRPTTFTLDVKNVGDASAFDVRLIAQLPRGTSFVQANNLGAYKEDEHCVYWDLAELPAQTNAEIELTLQTTEASQAELIFGAQGPNNLTAQTSHTVSIEGIAALSFNVSSSTDLVEVGREFEYTVKIENRGTKESNNVVLQVLTTDAISILATDGPTKATSRKGVVVFEKIPSIPAKSSVTYKIKAKPNANGDCRVEFQLSSDDLEPLVKEENTRVY